MVSSMKWRGATFLLTLLLAFRVLAETPVWGYDIVADYPHDPEHFTQGLVWHEGRLFESTGLYGASAVYEKNLLTGVVVNQRALHPRLFGEGLAVHNARLWQLTWREGVGLVYDLDLTPVAQFALRTEGWGLTGDGTRLWMTDGSATLHELDPRTGAVIDRMVVRNGGQPIARLNELEWINGLIFANRYRSDEVVIIRPDDGTVIGTLDLSVLRTHFDPPPGFSATEDVLNGIAWRADTEELLVTGKRWPRLFVLRLHWPTSVEGESRVNQ